MDYIVGMLAVMKMVEDMFGRMEHVGVAEEMMGSAVGMVEEMMESAVELAQEKMELIVGMAELIVGMVELKLAVEMTEYLVLVGDNQKWAS